MNQHKIKKDADQNSENLMEIGADFDLDESSLPYHNMMGAERSIHSPSEKF